MHRPLLVLASLIVLAGAQTLKKIDPYGRSVLNAQLQAAKPGDVILLPDAVYEDFDLTIETSGTAKAKIVVRAEHPGLAQFTGKSRLLVKADHVEVSGLFFRDGGIATKDGHVIQVIGKDCRVSDCAVVGFNQGGGGKQWVRLAGPGHRFDRNHLEGKTTVDPVLQVEVDSNAAQGTLIDRNYFGPRPPLPEDANGGETIRIGYSGQSRWTGGVLLASNVFEECDGETEIVSVKSGANRVVDNDFISCAGTLTFRHGNGSEAFRNFFLASRKKETGGIRVIGGGHRIVDNLFWKTASRMGGALNLNCAQPNFKDNGYWTVRDVTVRGNLFLDNDGPAVMLSSMKGAKGGTVSVLPSDVRFESNRYASQVAALFAGEAGERITFTEERGRGDKGTLPAGAVLKTAGANDFDVEAFYVRVGRKPLDRKSVGVTWPLEAR